MVAAGCVNYIDRSTLAIANHDIASELHFTPGEMGLLLSAFAWSYGLCQLPAGILTDRFGPHIMLTAGMTAWSLAQAISGMVGTFGQFLVIRLGLGVGESPMFTAGARATVNWFPAKDRGVPLGLFNAASSLGPAVAPPMLTALMLAYGWRPMFVIMGIAGLGIAVLWWFSYREPQEAGLPEADLALIHEGSGHDHAPGVRADWRALLAIPSTWALAGGLTGLVYITWLYVSWLPDYLESARGVSVAETGFLAAIPQFAGFAGGCLGGWVSDLLVKSGIEPVTARKIPTIGGLLLAGVATLPVPFVSDLGLALTLISAAMFFAYGAGSCSWALGAALTPPRMVATLEAIQNIGGSAGGVGAPLVTGLIVQYAHSFGPAFLFGSFAAVLSALSYAFVRKDDYISLNS